jgi:hypothetical protein
MGRRRHTGFRKWSAGVAADQSSGMRPDGDAVEHHPYANASDRHMTDVDYPFQFDTFGSGLMQLVFAPNSDELSAATQFLVQGALQQWLGDLIVVESVQVENRDSTLRVSIQYVVRRNQTRQTAEFSRGGTV